MAYVTHISTRHHNIDSSVLRTTARISRAKKIAKFLKGEGFGLWGTLSLVFLLLAFKSSVGEGQPTLFSNLLKETAEETAASLISYSQSPIQLADISSITSSNASELGQGGEPTEIPNPSTVQENSLQALNPASTDYVNSFKADQVVKYTVQSGDNIGSIASNFGVSINTIVWANNLANPNVLSLGQVLKIPPVTGVIHTVKNGDTIASIAGKYKANSDKILSFNNLENDQNLEIGNELIVPGGELPGPKPSIKPTIASGSGGHGIYIPTGNGQCVDFVQAHGFARMSGNANTWKRYINTPVPVAGGVVVLKGGRYGHVALITAVLPGSIQVVEQNYYGPYIIDHREISLSDRLIVGFIQ